MNVVFNVIGIRKATGEPEVIAAFEDERSATGFASHVSGEVPSTFTRVSVGKAMSKYLGDFATEDAIEDYDMREYWEDDTDYGWDDSLPCGCCSCCGCSCYDRYTYEEDDE